MAEGDPILSQQTALQRNIQLPAEIPDISDLPRLDLNDPLAWAQAQRIRDEWIRRLAESFGLDLHTFILGGLLSSILGDDIGAFGNRAVGFIEQYATRYRNDLFERMDWEISSLELPDAVRTQIIKVRKQLESIDMETETGYYEARTLWTDQVCNFTDDLISQDNELQTALFYYLNNGVNLKEFIADHILIESQNEESL